MITKQQIGYAKDSLLWLIQVAESQGEKAFLQHELENAYEEIDGLLTLIEGMRDKDVRIKELLEANNALVLENRAYKRLKGE